VLLVAGGNRLSTAIKYLMQSTWSHAALYVGNAIAAPLDAPDGHTLIEVNLGEGCVVVPLASVIATTPASTGRSGSPKLTAPRSSPSWYRASIRNTTCEVVDLARYLQPGRPRDPLARRMSPTVSPAL
jgi:hypothetical protein